MAQFVNLGADVSSSIPDYTFKGDLRKGGFSLNQSLPSSKQRVLKMPVNSIKSDGNRGSWIAPDMYHSIHSKYSQHIGTPRHNVGDGVYGSFTTAVTAAQAPAALADQGGYASYKSALKYNVPAVGAYGMFDPHSVQASRARSGAGVNHGSSSLYCSRKGFDESRQFVKKSIKSKESNTSVYGIYANERPEPYSMIAGGI